MTASNEWSELVPPELKQVIQANHRTHVELQEEFVPSTYVNNPCTGLGVPLLRHTHALAYSIGSLLKCELVAAGFALFRPLFEGYARGIWVLQCADEQELRNAYKDVFPKLTDVVKAIGELELDSSSWFSEVFDLNKKSFHSLTHGGTQMIVLLYADDTEKIEPDYPIEAQLRLMSIVEDVTRGAAEELRKHLKH